MSEVKEKKPAIAKERKRMSFFRAADAPHLDFERMPLENIDESVMAGFAKLMATGVQQGTGEKTVVLFSEPGDQGMSLVYGWFKSGYVLPRHSHSADCLYYVIAGELRLGNRTIRKGDGFFIPKDAGYTYEVGPNGLEILEFRNTGKFNFVFKNNDEAYWDKIAAAQSANAEKWADEVPPSAH
jgi:hypothetical protein